MNDLKQKKVAVISLGCDKNRVDTEYMLGRIREFSALTDDAFEAEIIIVNTCAFLESARRESIDTIIEFNAYRQAGKLEKLVVTGCLPQKYIGEIFDELTEADIFLGFKDYDLLEDALKLSYEKGVRVNFVGKKDRVETNERYISTPPHYAYLKIADGCNNHCTYCLIPSIRGRYRSEDEAKLLDQAKNLGDLTELILVAQDITRYGTDIYGKPSLVDLIRKLSALDNIKGIRLLYCYPDMINDELIDEMANNEKIIKYIDIPLQHADDGILKLMGRPGTGKGYLDLIEKLKSKVSGIAVRSTFIAGFSGEDEAAFETLKDFLIRAKLFNAGFFAYSPEEGTPSFKLKNRVPAAVRNKRVRELYALQRTISAENLSAFKGKVIDVVFDGIDYDKEMFKGRAYFSAPDIDGCVYFTSNITVEQGKIYKVKIKNTDAYDLYGSVYNEN